MVGSGAAFFCIGDSSPDDIDGFRLNNLALVMSTIPGKQSVPRAETFGVSYALRLSKGSAQHIGVDASYTVNGCNAPKHTQMVMNLMRGTNGDA